MCVDFQRCFFLVVVQKIFHEGDGVFATILESSCEAGRQVERIHQEKTRMSMLGFRSNNNGSHNDKANKHVPQPPDPDVLMRQMDRSIATVECGRATTQLSKYLSVSKRSDNGKAMRAKDESALLAKNG